MSERPVIGRIEQLTEIANEPRSRQRMLLHLLGEDVRKLRSERDAALAALRELVGEVDEHKRKMGGTVWQDEAQACWPKATTRLWDSDALSQARQLLEESE